MSKNDCYSGGERKFMEWGQRVRGKILFPLLILCQKTHITPDNITLISLLCGLVTAAIFPYAKILSLLFLLLHVLLDGIDGPLARHIDKASNKGSFTDTAADQIVIFAMSAAVVFTGHANAIAAIAFVMLYTVVVAFSMVRNALNIPYSWLVRPRFFFYLWIPIELWLLQGSLNWLLWTCNILLIVKAISGFYFIRKKL